MRASIVHLSDNSPRTSMNDQGSLKQLRDAVPFAAHIGIALLEASPDLVRGQMPYSQDRTTAGDLLHGGALMALADTCGAICAFLNIPAGATGTATIESKTNFMRGVRQGSITATTRPLHKGRTMIVLETEIVREDGALAAKTIQTQAFHYPRGEQR
jgi:uncharacterized protein (TIGR00369 family)